MIRPAQVKDIPALCLLMQHVQKLHAKAHPDIFKATLDPKQTAEFFSEILSNKQNVVLVAESNNAIRGYLWCQERVVPESFYASASHFGYINHVSVEPGKRRRGVGRALVKQVLVEMERRGAARVGVDFWTFNERARAFFNSVGFVVYREICSKDLR